MYKTVITTATIVLSLLILVWSGCKKDNGPDTEEYIIQVDSIIHLDTITFGEDLSIKFYGVVGPNGCYEFDRLEPSYTEGELAITCWGIQTMESICTEQLVYMNGQQLLVSEMPLGNTIIKAIQPDGSSISQNVFVKE